MLVPLVLLVLSATGASGGDPALFNSLDAGGPAWDALPMAGMADFAGAAATPGSYSSGIRGAPRAFDGFGGDRMLDRALGDRALGDSVSATNNEVPAALDTPVGPRPMDMRSRDPNNPLSKVPGLRDAEEREDYHGDEKAVSGTSEDAGWARRMGGSVGRRGWGVGDGIRGSGGKRGDRAGGPNLLPPGGIGGASTEAMFDGAGTMNLNGVNALGAGPHTGGRIWRGAAAAMVMDSVGDADVARRRGAWRRQDWRHDSFYSRRYPSLDAPLGEGRLESLHVDAHDDGTLGGRNPGLNRLGLDRSNMVSAFHGRCQTEKGEC